MSKLYSAAIVLLMGFSCLAQDPPQEPSKESQAYHQYREKITVPPYGLQKVENLIGKIKEKRDLETDDVSDALSDATYGSLSLREKFTYNMIHDESYSQNCDVTYPASDEQKKIFAHLADPLGEGSWSGRQARFFKTNKDSVIALMTESIGRSRRIGLNYKYVIVYINATEMIPLLINTYNLEKKDHDILTVLLLLMKNNEYPPFMSSTSYTKLYLSKSGYYDSWLVFNTANEELIIQRATGFYNGLAK